MYQCHKLTQVSVHVQFFLRTICQAVNKTLKVNMHRIFFAMIVHFDPCIHFFPFRPDYVENSAISVLQKKNLSLQLAK